MYSTLHTTWRPLAVAFIGLLAWTGCGDSGSGSGGSGGSSSNNGSAERAVKDFEAPDIDNNGHEAIVEGIYEVTSHTLNTSSCTDGGGDAFGDEYFKIARDESSTPDISFWWCTSPTECEDAVQVDMSCYNHGDECDFRYGGTASTSDTHCSYQIAITQMAATDDGVRILKRRFSAEFDDYTEECDADKLGQYLDQLECSWQETLVGTLVPADN